MSSTIRAYGGGTAGLSTLEVLNNFRVSQGQAPLSEAEFAEYVRSGATEQVEEAKEWARQADASRKATAEEGAAIVEQAQQAVVAAGAAGAEQVDQARVVVADGEAAVAAQVDLVAGQVTVAQVAADSALSAVHADYRGSTNDRLALTGMTADQVFYDVNTGHMWQWTGTTWDDKGVGVLATKANKTDVDRVREEVAAPREALDVDAVQWIGFDRDNHALYGYDATGMVVIVSDRTVGNIADRMDLSNLPAISDVRAAIGDEVSAREADTGALRLEAAAPRETLGDDDVDWIEFDRVGNALSGYDATGRVLVLADRVIVDIASRMELPDVSGLRGEIDTAVAGEAEVRAQEIASVRADVAAPHETAVGTDMRGVFFDEDGRAIGVWRSGPKGGFDMRFCAEFWEYAATELSPLLGGTTPVPELSTTELFGISVNGQSLTVSGEYAAPVTAAYLRSLQSAAVLQLAGMRRSDNVLITDTLGPRSVGYNLGVASSGLELADIHPSASSMPYMMATAVNMHRADLGLPLVPVVTTAHGISGIQIENMDPDPTTGGAGNTTVWDNFSYWYAQLQTVAAAAGKSLTVPWHVWTHGTSAKSSARGVYAEKWWALQRDSLNYLDGLGIVPPRYIMTQSGGDANTTNGVWGVCDDQLDICMEGGAVLATPLYWYEIADDNVHPDSVAQALFCDTYAWAMSEVDNGRQWTIRRPVATWNATALTLTLHFDSLREDEWLVAEDAAKYAASGGIGLGADALGFEAVGATISAVTLRGHAVILTCSAKPASVKYAMQAQDMRSATTGATNRYNAHRGLLRTSKTKPAKLIPGATLVRAVPSFTLNL